MENDVNCVRLVKRAQLGDKESLERLSKLAEESLRDDVYRMTLEHDLTEDIVQETVLEMLKILGKLEEADRFWPWLYKIALNKMRLHRRGERLRSTVPISAVGDIEEPGDGREAMSELAARELKAIIFGAMGRLKPGQREVLTMRCYKEMDYSAIAATLGCSEFTARKRFWRAKKALQKQLARQGFGRGSLLMALVLFGKMTAASEAAAGHVSVTAATIKVGAAASLVGVMASKTAVVTLAAAGVIGAGAIVATSEPENAPGMVGMKGHESSQAGGAAGRAEKVAGEYLYYFPEGTDAPMMMRAMESDSKGKSYFCKWMQDEEGNYVFDRRKGVLHINNYRQFNGDLSVWRVPTDGSALRDFLSQVTGRVDEFEYGGGDVAGLMAVVRHGENGRTLSVSRHRRLLDEEYFRYSWHGGTRRVDGRDEMHRRGWTYFRISGRIGGERVSGTGRMPFVYAESGRHSPWLRLKVGNEVRFVDGGGGAVMYRGRKAGGKYAAGSFFRGLSRPWMGLHTIDTVRRDAARSKVWFEAEYTQGEEKAEVILTYDDNKLVYTINMETDVVEEISFVTKDGVQGQMVFEYLQNIDDIRSGFTEPGVGRYAAVAKTNGILWLFGLVNGE